MAKSKYNPKASVLITDYINQLPPFSKEICFQLRAIILAADSSIVEDWKWGPNYFCEGMVCGFGAFKKHVSFVLFQGALLNDPNKMLIANPGNIHNRHIRIESIDDIHPKVITTFIKQAIKNNKTGLKVLRDEKTIEIPNELVLFLKKKKLLKDFETLAFYKRKEMINWLMAAKREETRLKRLDKIAEMIVTKTFFY